jgi:hypothetical protein
MAPFVGVTLLYNWMRFGAWQETGYKSMEVVSFMRPALEQYGIFSLHFLARGLYYMLLAPPRLISGGIEPDPFGMSIFLVSPAFLLSARAFLPGPLRPLALACLMAVVTIATPLVTYYTTGWWQFGSRFSLDYLPFLVLLIGIGVRGRITRLSMFLIMVSVGISFAGAVWFSGRALNI